jgi:trans-2,3-dihydro-3-hydroxyanthranilate isomerase
MRNASEHRKGIEKAAVAEIPFALYDSFAARRFGGNVAGIVVVHPLPSDKVMQAVAAELGAPTTGFVDTTNADSPTVRLFTPRCEIDACGHVSLAVAVDLMERGEWSIGDRGWTEARLEMAGGSLHVRLLSVGSGVRVGLRYSPRLVGRVEWARASIDETFGVGTDADLPVEVFDTGLRHLVVGFPTVQDLAELQVSDERVRTLAQLTGVDTICAFSSLGSGRFRMRDLTAAIGAVEEPASGTTSSALAAHACEHGLLGEDRDLWIEQGVEMGRPSSIEVELEPLSAGGSAWVTGTAIRTATGSVIVSDPEEGRAIRPIATVCDRPIHGAPAIGAAPAASPGSGCRPAADISPAASQGAGLRWSED